MQMKRRTFAKTLAAGAGLIAAPRLITGAQAADPFKAAWIYVGPVGDFGWSYQHDQGRKAVEAALGDQVKTTYVESVPEGADAERVLRELATAGNKIIFATSFGFWQPALKVAKQFADVKFEHATGYKRAENLATYNIRFYEGRYVQGVIAGMMSKAGLVGFIGSVPIPEVIMGMNAFVQGMRSVNPKGRLKFVMINAWYDPGKEADAAKALLDQGCDMIAQHTDSPAPLQTAHERGVKGFGQASDMIKFAPDTQLTSSVDHWDEYYVSRVKAAMDGSWKSGDVWGGLKSGMLHMAPFTNMPDDVKAAAEKAVAGIESGEIQIFKGPINAQDGSAKVKDGEVLDDGAVAGMDWLAEGVEGQLPK
jgi:simple sugar transport system substrate-binding protein